MKNSITLLIAMSFLLTLQAKVIKLDEAELNPTDTIPVNIEKSFEEFIIPEKFSNQFELDAIGFVCKNFKMKEYLKEHLMEESDSYQVNFKSRKGFLRAHYNSNGDMIRTSQRFKDKSLPYEVRNEIFSKYKGWDITKSIFIARGTGEKIGKGFYKIRVEKGNQKEQLKIFIHNNSLQNSKNALANN